MSEIIIHIGTNKTGSTSIQGFMEKNAGALLQQGICYPQTFRQGGAHKSLSQWLMHQTRPRKFPSDDPRIPQLLEEIKEYPKVVLSTENFCTLPESSISVLQSIFKDHKIKIVVYLREHLSYLASWYSQAIQASSLTSDFDYFSRVDRHPLFPLIEAWGKVFGAENVCARHYDRASLVNNDVVSDLLAQIDSPIDTSSLAFLGREKNPSISGNLLFFKRIINNFTDRSQAGIYSNETLALSDLKPSFTGHMHVNAEMVALVSKIYTGDRLRLKTHYGITMPELSGERPGQLVPNMDTLADDWALIVQTAHERQYKLASLASLLEIKSLKNF